MRFGHGSLNAAKNEALWRAIKQRIDIFPEWQLEPRDVPSGVPKQPLDLETTLRGAANRAWGSFYMTGNDVGVGIESGLLALPLSRSGWGDVTTCVIYDGTRRYVGTSSIFEVPSDIMQIILERGSDLSEASRIAGYNTKANVDAAEGIIGVLTEGHITRTDYTVQAVQMALMHFIRDRKRP